MPWMSSRPRSPIGVPVTHHLWPRESESEKGDSTGAARYHPLSSHLWTDLILEAMVATWVRLELAICASS